MRRLLCAIALLITAFAQKPQLVGDFTVPDVARFVLLAPDGKHIVVATAPTKAMLFDAVSKSKLRDLESTEDAVASAFSPDGSLLGVAMESGAFQVWTVADGKLAQSGTVGKEFVTHLCFSPDSKRLAIGSDSGAIRIFDVASGKSVGPFSPAFGGTWGMAFATDGTLATADEDTNVRLWDPDGKLAHAIEYSLVAPFAVGFANDGKTIVVGGAAKVVKVMDRATGKTLKEFPTGRFVVRTIVLSPDSHYAAVQTMDQNGFGLTAPLQVWDISAGKKIFEMPSSIAASMTFDAKSNLLVANTKEHAAQLWSVSFK
jgi:WD40 repeat protein